MWLNARLLWLNSHLLYKLKEKWRITVKYSKKLCLNAQSKMSKVVRQAACSSCSQQQSGCKSIWAHMARWRHRDWSLQTDNLHLNITGSRYGFETASGNSHFITETSCLCVSSSSVAHLPTNFCHISLSLSLKRRLSSCFMDYTASALMCLFINYGCNFVPLSNLYLFKRRTASEERGKRKSVISCHTFYTFIA